MAWLPNIAMGGATSDVAPVNIVHVLFDEGARKRPLNRENINSLKKSFLEHGVLQPIGVLASEGSRGAPFKLVYGAHRFAAKKELLESGEWLDSAIPAVIYPSETPPDLIEMIEIAENLVRRELSPPERDAQTTRMAALLVKGGKKASKAKGNANGRRGNKTIGESPIVPEPTAVEVIATQTGITAQTAARRIKQAAKAAGVEVDLPTATAEVLQEIADKAEERVEKTKAERVEKAKGKHGPSAKARKDVEAIKEKSEDPAADMSDEMSESYRSIMEAIDNAEATYGLAFVQAVVRTWWTEKHPDGEVRFNPQSYSKG